MSVKNALEQSVLKTLAYFDIANYPLTKEELFRFLWQPPAMGYGEFCEGDGPFEPRNGYYFFPGRECIVEDRRRKIVFTEKKLERAIKAAKKIRSIPFLKAIFVCNTVGAETADKDSDIDFFIVTEKKRVWLVRFFANFILRLFRLRTYGKKSANRVCLSFFVDVGSLNLAALRVAPDDIHFAYWIHQMVPIYDPENFYAKFIEANIWTKQYLPNLYCDFASKQYLPPLLGEGQARLDEAELREARRGEGSRSSMVDETPLSISPLRGERSAKGRSDYQLTYRFQVTNSRLGKIWKKVWEKFWGGAYGNILESQARQMQWQMMKLSVKELSKKDDKGVVLTEGVIKVHEKDARGKYREEWLKLIKFQIQNLKSQINYKSQISNSKP